MKKEIDPEILKKSDDETLDRLEEKFKPEWNTDKLFEESYRKYLSCKNNVKSASVENTIGADVIVSERKRKNIVLRLTACAAVFAVTIFGIRYITAANNKLPGRKQTGISSSVSTKGVPSEKLVINVESKIEPCIINDYDITKILQYRKNSAIFEGISNKGNLLISTYNNSGKLTGTTNLRKALSDIKEICVVDDIMYISYNYSCLEGIDKNTGDRKCIKQDIHADKIIYDGKDLIIYDRDGLSIEILDKALVTQKGHYSVRTLLDDENNPIEDPGYFKAIQTAMYASGDVIYIAAQKPASISEAITVYALKKETGEKIWEKEIPDSRGNTFEMFETGDDLGIQSVIDPSSETPEYLIYQISKKDGSLTGQTSILKTDNSKILDPKTGNEFEIQECSESDEKDYIHNGDNYYVYPCKYGSIQKVFYSVDDDGNENKVVLDDSIYNYQTDYAGITDDGELYIITFGDDKISIRYYNMDGSMKDTVNTSIPMSSVNTELISYCLSGEKNLFIIEYDNGQRKVLETNRKGNVLNEAAMELAGYSTEVIRGKTGFYIINVLGGGEKELYCYSNSELTLTEHYPSDAVIFEGNDEYDYFYKQSDVLYGYSASDNSSTELMKLSDYGIETLDQLFPTDDHDAFIGRTSDEEGESYSMISIKK